MHNLENIEELEKGKIIIVFSTDWCGDCVALKQYIHLIVDKYKDDWKFVYVDSDENIELSKHYNVFGIPSFVALIDGEKKADYISKEAKSFEQICNWIESIKED